MDNPLACDDCRVGEPHACPELHEDYLDLLAVRGHVDRQLALVEAPGDDGVRGIAARLRGAARRDRG